MLQPRVQDFFDTAKFGLPRHTHIVEARVHVGERNSSMLEFTSPMREFTSPSRELLIRMPISTVSIVGIDASAIGRIWLSFISNQRYQNSAISLTRKRSAGVD